MNFLRKIFTGIFCASLLAGCAVGPERELVGRLWLPDEQRFIDEAQLLQEIEARRFVLLGEIHDHPEHHRIRAQWLDALAERGRRPVVALEMITRLQRGALQRYQQDERPDPAGLGEALDWEETGWPDWEIYQPIAEVAFSRGLTLADANAPRTEVRELVHAGGLASLAQDRLEELGLDRDLPDDENQRLLSRLRASHCHGLSDEMLKAMRDAQRLRDGHMAMRLREVAGRDGAVLIAGNGHLHNSYGVPWYLRRAGEESVFTLALIPVEPGKTEPQDYRAGEQRLPFDAVRFTTPRPTPPPDPCA